MGWREKLALLFRLGWSHEYADTSRPVTASFAGRDAHCFEYRAVLCDTADNHWLIEGVNVMKLEQGLISRLRSFEDAPRRLPTEGGSP